MDRREMLEAKLQDLRDETYRLSIRGRLIMSEIAALNFQALPQAVADDEPPEPEAA